MAASFLTSRFQDALKDWVVADNQSLRVIETPQSRAMIAAVNLLSEEISKIQEQLSQFDVR
jgi:hypothetical protein